MCGMPIYRLYYVTMVCDKEPTLVLRNNYGKVTYDRVKNQAMYPSTVPEEMTQLVMRSSRDQRTA